MEGIMFPENNVIYKKVCRNCGIQFQTQTGKDSFGHEIVWCSDQCKSRLSLCECKKCFKEYYSAFTNSKHCSEECKKENCLVCNSIFIPNSVLKHHCSDKCKKIYYTHDCKSCGDEFYKEQKNAKFCCNECRIAFNEVKKMAKNNICKNCKRIFSFIDDKAEFCSPDCRIEYVSKRKGIYQYKLEVAEQRKELFGIVADKIEVILKKREELIERRNISNSSILSMDGFPESLKEKIKQRDGYACYICEDTHTLEVYHILPQKLGGTHEEDNLVTFCTKCHRAIETGNKDHATSKCFSKILNILGSPSDTKQKNNKDILFDTETTITKVYEELAEKNINGEFEEILIKLDDLLDELNAR
jgi:hypothetical protein